MRETLVKTEEFKDSPLGKIPQRWEVVRLGEIADLITSGSRGWATYYSDEGALFLRVGNLTREHLNLRLNDIVHVCPPVSSEGARAKVQAGDLLISITADLGMIGVIPKNFREAYVNQHIALVRLNQSQANPRWVGNYLAGAIGQKKFYQLNDAGAKAGLNLSAVAALLVALPPKKEQDGIAEILDTLDETIAHTSSLIAKLKQMKAGLLHDLLTRGLDENGELRDAIGHPEQFKDSLLGRIPKDWEIRTCESVCREIVVGIVIKPSQYYQSSGVPTLRSANVREAGLNPSDLVFISEQSNRLLAKSMIRTGDVLTVRTGYPGTSCVVPAEFDGANCVDIIISRPGSEIESAFLATWINSDFGKGQVLRVQGGLAQQHFNVGELQKLLIAKPSIEEQRAIQTRIEAYEIYIRTEEAYRDKLKLQKKGLMHDLLTGKVRVKDADKFTPASGTV